MSHIPDDAFEPRLDVDLGAPGYWRSRLGDRLVGRKIADMTPLHLQNVARVLRRRYEDYCDDVTDFPNTGEDAAEHVERMHELHALMDANRAKLAEIEAELTNPTA